MIETIAWRDLPFLSDNRLFLDYIQGEPEALRFYTHPPSDYQQVLDARSTYAFPRERVGDLLLAYHERLGASDQSLANTRALRDSETYCIVGGQQAGLLGGPAYTAYKILATIRMAQKLSDELGVTVVPIYWLASEDHDFGEINHAYFVQSDGEIGRVSFDWTDRGRPIADLPVTESVAKTLSRYWEGLVPGPFIDEVRAFASPDADRYCDWLARMWLDLFSDDGLIVVEPQTLRPAAGALFRSFIKEHAAIKERLRIVAQQLEDANYQPLLPPDDAGMMFTFDDDGQRIRLHDPASAAEDVVKNPQDYSTDAALRPLFADAMLPVLASMLGPGELAYQGMLKPLYELFEIPQPAVVPRKSYTIVSDQQRQRLQAYGLAPADILRETIDISGTVEGLMPQEDIARFEKARSEIEHALQPLKGYLKELDPNMVHTWEQALNSAMRNIDKLQERATNASLSHAGYSKHELRSLRNVLLPRGRLQERVFPVTHFLHNYGFEFLERLRSAGDLQEYAHDIVTLEESDA